jgi:HlyD family secretion protein
MTRKSIILTTILLFILLVIVKKKGYIGGEKPLIVKTEQVFVGSITETVPADGKIQPEIEIKISPDVSGEIIELKVKEGDWVNQNDLLLRINPEIYAANLDRMEASLNNIKAQLAQQKAQLKDAEIKFTRNASLFEKGAISSTEYETSQNNYELAQLAVKASYHNVESSEAAVKEVQNNLNRTSIFAPISGTISRLNVEQGERVVGTAQMTGTELLRIADFNQMEVIVDVSENDIMRVNLNDRAEVRIDAYSKDVFEGEVTEIANSANLIGTSADQVTNFEVKVRILKSSYEKQLKTHKHPFRPGMTASVDIVTSVKHDIKLLSIQSVTTRKDSSDYLIITTEDPERDQTEEEAFECVFVAQNGKAHLKSIETGIQDDQNIEIVKGLYVGQEVITAPYSAVSKKLRNQKNVQVENK